MVSIASTMAGLLLSRKMGSAVFTSLSLTAALVTSFLLDHFGWDAAIGMQLDDSRNPIDREVLRPVSDAVEGFQDVARAVSHRDRPPMRTGHGVIGIAQFAQ